MDLLGGLEHHFFYFPINIGLLIIPIDVHIFQRVQTTNQGWLLFSGESQSKVDDFSGVTPS